MSSQNDLEAGVELGDVQLVRMEDIQPLDKDSELLGEEEIETCIVDGDYEQLLEDDDSNIGSMVSIRSEEVEDGGDNTEIIIPVVAEPTNEDDPLTENNQQHVAEDERISFKMSCPDSWPTLEILPGGVINLAVKKTPIKQVIDSSEMMYACAKCSQSFQYLFSLVKHVRTHDEEKKNDLSELTIIDMQYKNLKKRKIKAKRKSRMQKIPKKS